MTDERTFDALWRDLTTLVVGRAIERHERVVSTNDLARERAHAGAAEGLVVLAEEQTAGRGRLGRGWAAPPGSSLLLSVLLRPAWLPPNDTFALTMLAGAALCEAVEEAAPVRAALKWPNDLMLPEQQDPTLRKAAGILSELHLEQNRVAWVVLGMGVNVNWAPAGIVDGRDLALTATSVSRAAGVPIDRMALLQALLRRLDARYAALRQGRRQELFDSWRARLATLGQTVRISLVRGELRGVAEGVEPSGALRVRDAHGDIHTILTGEVGQG